MIALEFTQEFKSDLERLSEFLLQSHPEDFAGMSAVIMQSLKILTHSPEIGRPYRLPVRELVISRGKSGYLALYQFKPRLNKIELMRIRHQREVGYKRSK